MLRLGNGACVPAWRGVACVAFVIDAMARVRHSLGPVAATPGRRLAPGTQSARADCVPGAHEPALHERRPAEKDRLVHHSDRASQHVSLRCAERLAEAGVEPGAGSVGNSDDNALAGTINGSYAGTWVTP